jgi:hypothetical protein
LSTPLIPRWQGVRIEIAHVDLAVKLDALGSAVAAVRDAHRDGIPAACWAALNRAQEAIAEAILTAKKEG